MSKRDWEILFEDIIESIIKIDDYTRNITFEDFAQSSLIMDAVVRNFEIIGEASKTFHQKYKINSRTFPGKK